MAPTARTSTGRPWIADALGRLPEGWLYEIDEGERVVLAPAGYRHSAAAVAAPVLAGAS